MIINLRAIFSSLLVLSAAFGYAQAPNISYTSPQTFYTGTAISVVKPTNTGGAVPAFAYGQVNTFAGAAGVAGKVDATGAAARFSSPGALTVDAAGNIFVIDGGNNVIRKISPAGAVTTYAGTGAYGALNGPAAQATFVDMSGIAADAGGNLYIAEEGNELIRKITPGGVVSTFAGKVGVYGFADGQDTTAIFSNPFGIAVDKSGNVYVTDVNNYLIRKITPAGLVSTLAGKRGVYGATNGPDTSATFSFPNGIAIDAAGNLFITDNNQVRKISTDGVVSTFAGGVNPGSVDGVGTAASFNTLSGISIDALGNLYVSDANNYTIRKITPDGTVSTLAGTHGETGSANGIGAAAQFGAGIYVAAGAAGNVFVSDILNNTIRKLAITGYGIDKALPTGLTFDGTSGKISGTPVNFSPATDYTVTGYNLSGSSASKINITITGTLSFPLIPAQVYGVADFSPAVSTSGAVTYTSSNTAVATVVSGNIHVIGAGTSTITATNGGTTLSQLLTVNTAPLTVIADNKSKNYHLANPALTITYDGFVNGDSPANFSTQPVISTPASTTTLPGSYPISVRAAVNKNYKITFIAGTLTILGGSVTIPAPQLTYPAVLNYTSGVPITAVTPANAGGAVPGNAYGQVTAIAGSPGQGGYADGTGAAARFQQPNGVALDAAGNIYVADVTNNVIRKITPAGVVTTIAGRGTTELTNFVFPAGVTVDAAGNVYLTDTFNNLIKKVTPQGIVSVFAGGGSQQDGQGTQASFGAPSGITIDKSGNLYVTGQGDDLIRKITPAGMVSTIAGKQYVQGSANGQGTAATFSRLNEIAVDTSNNLYVTDGNLVRKITAGGLVSTLAGSGAFSSVDGAGTAASFQQPWGVAAEPNGMVYVAEYNQVRKITPGGVVSTIIGAAVPSGTVTQNTVNFDFMGGLTIDPSGSLYACDIAYNFVAKITATGYTIDKTLPAGLVFDATNGKISGTPTVPFPPTFFTINAYNIGGASTSIIKLSVAPSTNAALSGLKISTGSLSPAFTAATTGYTASVPNTTSSITVTPTAAGPNATIKVNGTIVASGSASAPIALVVGSNTVDVAVTAQDGATTQTYIIVVTRAASSNAYLSNLKVTTATLSPAFAFKTMSYSSSVPNSTTSVTITPTLLDATASALMVNGRPVANKTASGPIMLAVGANTIPITITAQDGITTQTYAVTITRAPSAVATLSNLQASNGTLTPAFASNTTGYTATVATTISSITVTPTTTDTAASVTVNGKHVASNTASGAISLAIGTDTITTVVTAGDGVTRQTYRLIVTRDAAGTNNAYLSNLKVTTATLSPAFAFKTLAYTSNVPNSTSSVTVTPTLLDATASVMVNGTAATNKTASGPIALAVGTNTINVVVTAQDGITTNTYTVAITRAAGGVDTFDPGLSVNNPLDHPSLNDDIILVHSGLSPNGDGINDFLQIDGILAYPDNKLSVMNRSGQLVYEATGYDNSSKVFDGHSNKNGQMQLPGTYFYQLDYTVNGVARHKTGFIVLKY